MSGRPRALAARARTAFLRAVRTRGNDESTIVVLGVVGGLLFLTLVVTLFLVQRGLVKAQQQLALTALPTEQALGGLEAALGNAFERQAQVTATRSAAELEKLLDRTAIENEMRATEALLQRRLSAGDNAATLRDLPAHAGAFLDADRELLLSVERRHLLRTRFEARLTEVDTDLAALIQATSALSGVLQLEHVLALRRLAAQMASGPPSADLVRSEVLGGGRGRIEEVADLMQAVTAFGRLGFKTGMALSDDALNSVMANEVTQNRSRIEGLLLSLGRSAPPASDVGQRVQNLAERFHAISPRISDEGREDSLIWLRRHSLMETAHVQRILKDCAASARVLTADLEALSRSSSLQADNALRSSASTTHWSRLGSFLISLVGLLVCVMAGLRIRASVRALRGTNRELADLRDNLELKVAERTSQLSASREQYRLLVETTNTVPFEMVLTDFKFRYIGPQAEELFGVNPGTCLGRGYLEQHVHPDDKAKALETLSSAFAKGTGHVDLEMRIRRSDGGYTWVRLIAAISQARSTDELAVVDAEMAEIPSAKYSVIEPSLNEPTLRGILLDVTQTHELEIQLRQAQKLESVGRLASGVAHEINTPVQFVNDNVHFLKEAFTDLAGVLEKYRALGAAVAEGTASTELAREVSDEEERIDIGYVLGNAPPALERSIEGLGRIADIVRSMKEFAHPDQKEMTAIDLNQALGNTLTMARNEYKYVADVETNFGDIPAVTCHAGEMNQVFLNILVNAAHAIADVVTGTDRRGRISVASRREGQDVVVSISDTGGGVPEHIRDRIFDPFFTTKEVGKGTGQGLAIARSVVVDKHGGEIRLQSEVGKGTTFLVQLPIAGKSPHPSQNA